MTTGATEVAPKTPPMSSLRVLVIPPLLIIGACILVSAVLIGRLVDQMQRGLLERSRTLAEVIARDAPLGVAGADTVALERLAGLALSQDMVAYVRFLDDADRVLLRSGATRPMRVPFASRTLDGTPIWTAPDLWELRLPVRLAAHPLSPEDLSLSDVPSRLAETGRLEAVGSVQLGIDVASLRRERRFAIAAAGGFTLVVAALAIAASIGFTRRHVRTLVAQAQLADERERVAELKTRIVTQTSHEFRTPLAVVLGAAQVLQRYHDRLSASDRETRLERIQRAVGQMTSLLDDVLALGRTEARQCKPEALDFDALLAEVLTDVRATAGLGRTIAIVSPPGPIPVECDPTLVGQAVRNLLTNALKYSADDSTVTLTIEVEADRFAVTVRDEGIGIPADDLPHLFEPFQRAHNVGARPGTGLGLAIARRGIRLHGGDLTVTTEEGKGSTFVIVLPRRAVPAGTDASDTSPHARAS